MYSKYSGCPAHSHQDGSNFNPECPDCWDYVSAEQEKEDMDIQEYRAYLTEEELRRELCLAE